jgi:aminoacrylate hydrolase
MPDLGAPRLTGRQLLCYQPNRFLGSIAEIMPRIAIGNRHLYYERHGAGYPILLISGLNGHAHYWRDQIPVFARHFEVIVHDHRGIGLSDPWHGPITIDHLAEDVVNLMDALGVERGHVVGHCLGAAMAQVLAIEHPKRLASLVLAGSWTKSDAYFRRLFALWRQILTELGPAAYLQSATLFGYPSWWISGNHETLRQNEAQFLTTLAPAEIIAGRIDAMLAFDRTDELRRVQVPSLIVGCEDDIVTPAYFSEDLARMIPGAEVKMFARGGHCFTKTVARDFNLAVTPFLKAHSPGT